MSKHNKVNKSNYDQAGRLTPDEMARERQKQDAAAKATASDKVTGRDRDAEASIPRRNEREESA
jgi:hypothetical protein